MRAPERTRQELDPVGTFATRILTVGSAVGGFIASAALVVSAIDDIRIPGLALLSLLCIGVVAVIVTSATDPYRAPFHRGPHSWAVSLAVFASVLLMTSAWGTAVAFQLGWVAPIALGLFSIGMSPYRPVRELVGYGSLAAIVIGFVSMLQVQANPIPNVSVPAVVGMHLLPLLALNFGGAAFTSAVVREVERWHASAAEVADGVSEAQRSGIARSVQQDRVSILNREVVPFFKDVLEGRDVTPHDRERARSISDAIRAVMVAEVDRTWLENLVDHLRGRVRRFGEQPNGARVVFDDDNVANQMNYDQRTALRALLVAIFDQTANRPKGLEIVIARVGDRCQGFVAVDLELPDPVIKSRFGPYLAVMRVVFRRLRAEHLQSVLTVRFSYDQR